MMNDYNCVATGIGSLPVTDPDRAAALSIQYLRQAPFWPQLPRRDFREQMDVQYSESLPGIVVDERNKRAFFDTSQDLTPALELFFERYLSKDLDHFGISDRFAAGFPAFIRALRDHPPEDLRFTKGHITGPLTAGTSLKDETGRDIIHNTVLFDALVKGLAMKAAWQIRELGSLGKPVVVFIDEPAMESLGSAFSAVSSRAVSDSLNEIIDTVHEAGGVAGIHCCGNADWSMILNTRVDIVNFDAFGYLDRVLLYSDDLREFYRRGGALAWGIVPTGESAGTVAAGQLAARVREGVERLVRHGVDRETVLRQALVTPSCGMGSMTPLEAEAVLKLLTEVSAKIIDMR